MSTSSSAQFRALLTGIYRRVYEGNDQITLQFLMDNVFKGTDITAEELGRLCTVCEKVLRRAGFEDWDVTNFDAIMEQSPLTEEQRDVFSKFWRAHRAKIHSLLVDKSSWDNELVRFSWRIDLQTKSKTVAELDDPTAILEFAIAPPTSLQSSAASGEASEHVVRFEMDQRQLAHAVHEFNK
eukprot:CAMPEP_0174241982 /NCGR_PEP_ID=MMETSP0417-20130205/25863_1 /TAXON_ID=242541 /ORGANISM="Mayorella sp, Strain BSH-02190019" /LENGTH=181 /DNA_ID=CAMNT_0015321321 /DNA_START=55 /DNA_END=597 /DNA_ORIENTATION=+